MSSLALVLLWTGCGLLLLSAIGVLKMPDAYMRMHAAAKAATLGSATLVVGVGAALGGPGTMTRAALITVFLILTTPLGAMLLASAARDAGDLPSPETRPDELGDDLAR